MENAVFHFYSSGYHALPLASLILYSVQTKLALGSVQLHSPFPISSFSLHLLRVLLSSCICRAPHSMVLLPTRGFEGDNLVKTRSINTSTIRLIVGRPSWTRSWVSEPFPSWGVVHIHNCLKLLLHDCKSVGFP